MKYSVILKADGQPFQLPVRSSRLVTVAMVVLVSTAVSVAIAAIASGLNGHEHIDTFNSVDSTFTHANPLANPLVNPSVPYIDIPLQEATREQNLSLDRALAAWRGALPASFIVSKPGLYRGSNYYCDSDRITLACADLKDYQIVISGSANVLADYDMDTILMHEIAHLLGVPHIEADALMNESYMQKLTAPSDQAVTLALLHWQSKGKR